MSYSPISTSYPHLTMVRPHRRLTHQEGRQRAELRVFSLGEFRALGDLWDDRHPGMMTFKDPRSGTLHCGHRQAVWWRVAPACCGRRQREPEGDRQHPNPEPAQGFSVLWGWGGSAINWGARRAGIWGGMTRPPAPIHWCV